MPVTALSPKASLNAASGKLRQWPVAKGDAVQQGWSDTGYAKTTAKVKSPGHSIISTAPLPTDGLPLVALSCGGIVDALPQHPCLKRIEPDLPTRMQTRCARRTGQLAPLTNAPSD